MSWQFGIAPLVLMTVFPSVYIAGRLARSFGGWLQNDQPPKERFGAHIVIAVILGLVIGGFAQPYYNCYSATHSVSACFT